MGPAVGQRAELIKDDRQHPLHIPADIGVREAKGVKSKRLMPLIARLIPQSVVGVAIDLNDQSFLRAEEIHDAVADDVLSAEFAAAEL